MRSPTLLKAKDTGRHVVTLPASLCRALGIEVGDTVEFEIAGRQAILRPESNEPHEDIRGVLRDIFPDWKSVEAFIQEERAGRENCCDHKSPVR
ncbi:MAG: AbrB/MazE/SpoVT family DNA-binding domain-containing protein [Thermomicrobiales bacterium]